MSVPKELPEEAILSVRNIGGIDQTEVTIQSGITILTGRNATNRTSLLQAVMGILGSDNVSLKGDATEAEVTLEFQDKQYSRTFTRSNGTIDTAGETYLDDPELAELFAFLLESNEARRAVVREEDLREIIMRPVDTTAIQAEITQLEAERDHLDDRLDTFEEQQHRLPDLEARRSQLQDDIEEKRTALEDVESKIDSIDTDIDDKGQKVVDEELDELRELREDLENIRYDIETEQESLTALQGERDEIITEIEDIPDPTERGPPAIETELTDLHDQRQQLQAQLSELQTVVQFNEELLEGDKPYVRRALSDASDQGNDGAITDQLVDDSVTCWTCGSSVERTAIEQTLDLLREVRSETLAEKDTLDERIDDLETEKEEFEERQRRRKQLEKRRDQLEADIEDTEQTIEKLLEKKAEVKSEITELNEAIDSKKTEVHEELIDLHEEANDLEFELGRLQNELDSIDSDIEEIETQLAERDEVVARREDVQDRLTELRTKIDTIQKEAIETFNQHMDSVLAELNYENLDRIWIERTQTEIQDGRGTATKPTFDIHVVRNSKDGTAYEDTIAHLSESEHEVVGLVFALAGYLVHDVHEECPFILLDSVEALDADRIASLVDYLSEYSEYLLIALLQEDAQALDSTYHRISDI